VEKRATVAFITLPRLDLKTLSKHDLLPAGWPQDAQKSSRDGLSDLGLTPFTELLLATDATTAGALQRLHTADVKLSRLTQAGAGELGDVAQVLTALQALLWQLAQNDAGWQHRLQQLSAAVTDDYPAAALTAQMPAPLRRTPALSWFGERLTAAEANQPPTTTDEPADEPADDGGDDPTPAGSDAVRTGSWDEDRFSLQYHPGGHADDFLKSWLELSLQLSRTELALAPFAQTLFDELADRSAGPGEAKGAGRCTKCHSIEQYDGSMLINWQARQPQPEYHDFTRFRHQPHLQLNTAEACTLCHKLQQEQPAEAAKSKFLQSFLSSNEPAVFTGNFAAMDKTTCDTCHSADSAGQSCVTCHNYHVGEFTPTMLQHTGNLLRPQQ
jgi:hypothetical protein